MGLNVKGYSTFWRLEPGWLCSPFHQPAQIGRLETRKMLYSNILRLRIEQFTTGAAEELLDESGGVNTPTEVRVLQNSLLK